MCVFSPSPGRRRPKPSSRGGKTRYKAAFALAWSANAKPQNTGSEVSARDRTPGERLQRVLHRAVGLLLGAVSLVKARIRPTKPPRLAQVHPRVVIISSVVPLAIVSARAARARATPRYGTKLIFSLGRARAGAPVPSYTLCGSRKASSGRAAGAPRIPPGGARFRPPSISGLDPAGVEDAGVVD